MLNKWAKFCAKTFTHFWEFPILYRANYHSGALKWLSFWRDVCNTWVPGRRNKKKDAKKAAANDVQEDSEPGDSDANVNNVDDNDAG